MHKIISSFLTIYRAQKNSMLSIYKRITGILTVIFLVFNNIVINVKEYFYLNLIQYNIIYYYQEFKYLINFLFFIILFYIIDFIKLHILLGLQNFFNDIKLNYNEINYNNYKIIIYDIIFFSLIIILLLFI